MYIQNIQISKEWIDQCIEFYAKHNEQILSINDICHSINENVINDQIIKMNKIITDLLSRDLLDDALKEFLKIFEVSPNYMCAYNIACTYSRLKDKDNALEWLCRSVELGFNGQFYTETRHYFNAKSHFSEDSDLDFIRDTDEYMVIVGYMCQ